MMNRAENVRVEVMMIMKFHYEITTAIDKMLQLLFQFLQILPMLQTPVADSNLIRLRSKVKQFRHRVQ